LLRLTADQQPVRFEKISALLFRGDLVECWRCGTRGIATTRRARATAGQVAHPFDELHAARTGKVAVIPVSSGVKIGDMSDLRYTDKIHFLRRSDAVLRGPVRRL